MTATADDESADKGIGNGSETMPVVSRTEEVVGETRPEPEGFMARGPVLADGKISFLALMEASPSLRTRTMPIQCPTILKIRWNRNEL